MSPKKKFYYIEQCKLNIFLNRSRVSIAALVEVIVAFNDNYWSIFTSFSYDLIYRLIRACIAPWSLHQCYTSWVRISVCSCDHLMLNLRINMLKCKWCQSRRVAKFLTKFQAHAELAFWTVIQASLYDFSTVKLCIKLAIVMYRFIKTS